MAVSPTVCTAYGIFALLAHLATDEQTCVAQLSEQL